MGGPPLMHLDFAIWTLVPHGACVPLAMRPPLRGRCPRPMTGRDPVPVWRQLPMRLRIICNESTEMHGIQ